MSCDSSSQGIYVASVCEGTKACARFFVLLAMIVSLMAAMRMLVRMRLYYDLLRHGIILDFTNPNPLKDPFFLMPLGSYLFSFTHFVLSWILMYQHEVSYTMILSKMKGEMVYFVAPVGTFLAFLYTSYDTEADLLPLNKYVEETSDDSGYDMGRLLVVREERVIAFLNQSPQYQMLSQAEGFIEQSDLHEELVRGAVAVRCRADESAESDFVDIAAHMINDKPWFLRTMWPTEILFDKRLVEDESLREFRYVWKLLTRTAVCVSIFVACFFPVLMIKDFQDVQEGQYEDCAALVVEVFYLFATLYVINSLRQVMKVR